MYNSLSKSVVILKTNELSLHWREKVYIDVKQLVNKKGIEKKFQNGRQCFCFHGNEMICLTFSLIDHVVFFYSFMV